MLTWAVAYSSWRMKSSRIRLETGVVHCTLGCFTLSSTSRDMAAAVKAFVVLPEDVRFWYVSVVFGTASNIPAKNNVEGVTGILGNLAMPYP